MQIVWACFLVALTWCMPEASVSSSMTCHVEAGPLTVMMCLGTYACCMKIYMRAFTTDGNRVSSKELQTSSAKLCQLLLRSE